MKVGDDSAVFMNPVTKLPFWRCRSDPVSKAPFSQELGSSILLLLALEAGPS